MHGMRDAENNQQDYGIERYLNRDYGTERKFESGLRDRAEI